MKNYTPKKPKTQREQVDMIWDAVFNTMTHRLDRMELMMKLTLTFGGLSLALLGLVIALTR